MVGLERTVVPLIGSQQFGLVLKTAIFSFIVSFGVVKACSNLVSGTLADRVGRKKVLVAGWVVGVPVPLMIALAPSWGWIVAANVLLGVNQGLAWSMTVLMKIDLVGPRGRGLAVGLNEFAGYRKTVWKGAHTMDETLAQALQNLKISDPVSHGLLHMFPLQGDTHAE